MAVTETIGHIMKVHVKGLKELEGALSGLNQKGIRYANADALNSVAFDTMREAKATIRNEFILRNKWTERGVVVSKATISRMYSEVGSRDEYMKRQELGGVKRSKRGAKSVFIPTTVASGEGMGAIPRKRMVRPQNRIDKLKLERSKIRAYSRRQRNLIAYKIATQTRSKFVYFNLGDKKGIFKIVRGTVFMIHDLTRQSVTTSAKPWLLPVAKAMQTTMRQRYADALQRQIDRLK